MNRRAFRTAVLGGVLLPALSCGLPVADIRSAALDGDIERAVRLARGELEGLAAAGAGTIDRLVAAPQGSAPLEVVAAMDAAPPALSGILEGWAADDSSVSDTVRTFARARLSEIEGGAYREQLEAVRSSPDPRVRAYALRGLLPGGVPATELVAALGDPSGDVAEVAARGLVRLAESPDGLPAAVRTKLRSFVSGDTAATVAATLAGLLDPSDPEDLAALVQALAAELPALRLAAARALGRLSDPRGVPEAAELLDGELRPAGLALALEAGRNGLTRLRDAYLARVFLETSRDDPLRSGALLALPDEEASRGILHEAVVQGGAQEQVAACEKLLGWGADGETCRGVLRRIAAAGSPPEAALAAAEVLFEDGDEPAAGWLRSYATQADVATRRSIMSGPAARRFDAPLLEVGLSDPEPSVAAAAAVSALRVPDPLARPGVAP